MQTITVTPAIENGRFFIDLPENLIQTDIMIQIIIKKITTKTRKKVKTSKEAKLEQVRKFAGIFKNSTYEVKADEWYMQ